MRKRRQDLILFCATLVVLVAACNSSAEPTAEGVLLADDFSNPRSGWMRHEDGDGYVAYLDGAYVVRIESPRIVLWGLSNAERPFSDVRIEVAARDQSDIFEVSFGVICHYTDADNFYMFEIGPDGFYRVMKLAAGEQTVLAGEEISPDIQIGQDTYRLQVDCAHGRQIMRVDGAEIARTTDSTHTNGDVGLLAHSYDRGGVEVHFDNLLVTTAPQE